MNETEVKKMLTAAQAYIVHLEAVQSEFSDKIGELVGANDMLLQSNADLARKLQYFKECNDNQARLIIKLHKEEHAY